MIEFRNVTKIYEASEKAALDNVSFRIDKGDFVFLIGATGAGKTTAARLILREDTPTRGEIIVNGKNTGKLRRRELPYYRRKIGMVFQDYRLLPYKTVFENVAFAMEAVGEPRRNIEHKVPQILSLVGLGNKAESYIEQLSGGEQQRTAMARAMANNPPILIADEPTGNLDPASAWEVMHLLERFNRLGTTVLVVTHARDLVNKMGRRIIELENGVLVRDERNSDYDGVRRRNG